ncbi:uncharacterized protein LODBEIA_P03450 [Lodderomyces beijingensis]|uniref:DOCKER domain-containing protein n=1 Tax=Lodderomyces beijingensis TaxID=1775926 RepID=A0ABP0ZH06_9ASCO
MTWAPTESFLKGKIVRPFLPNEKHPQLKNPNFKNLYPGDQVFIFEVKDDKWARGYASSRPMPNDFVATSYNLNDLPTQKNDVVVFPLSYVKVEAELPFPEFKINEEFNNVANVTALPTIHDSERDHREAVDGAEKQVDNRQAYPPYPENSVHEEGNICDEIKYTLALLTSHIFALYTMGEFKLFEKLVATYNALNETRVKLMFDLLTEEEDKVARETAISLLNEISKKLASKVSRLNQKSYDLDNEHTDIYGFKAILARDASTGEVLDLKNSTPARIALNSELGAFMTGYPVHAHNHTQDYSLTPPPNKNLNGEPPSHILVDFKSVSGSSAYQPPGFASTTAYLYLRNNDKRLTEAFAVHTQSVDELTNIEKISAALFKNLPSSEIINNKVFLVAVLTEEINLNNLKSNSQLPQIKRVKKGVAAGVADITRIFSYNEGSLISGEPHQFSIRLFGSYVNRKATKLGETPQVDNINNSNNGWGELVDRIIAGSGHGIAVNPRAERLTVTVKEFKHQFNANLSTQISTSAPISRIKPIFFDPLAENYERIYLKMGKVSLLHNSLKNELLTVEVSTPNNDLVTFAKASNQQEKKYWQFISIFPGESIGEIVKVNGVALKNSAKKVAKDDHIVLTLYSNGILAGEGKLLYKSGNRLVEFNKKKTHTVEIMSIAHDVPMAHIELSTQYIGKIYNSDVSIDSIFQYETFLKQGLSGIDELSNACENFCKVGIAQLVKYFPELLTSLYGIVDITCHLTGPNIERLEDNIFKSIIHLLDTLFGKQDQYIYLLDDFASKHKRSDNIGKFLLKELADLFRNCRSSWTAIARSACRVMFILMRLAVNTFDQKINNEDYLDALHALFHSITIFLAVDSPGLINEQILMLEIVDCFVLFRANVEDLQLLQLMISYVDAVGLRGLGADELTQDAGRKRVNKEHELVLKKLSFILRLFGTPLAKNEVTRRVLIAKAVEWVMEVFLGPTDIDATRLGCSILNTICTIMWEEFIPSAGNPHYSQQDLELCFSLAKFLPAIARTFIKYNKFTRGNGYFKSRRSFTRLFPSSFPFTTLSVDIIVNDDVLVEVLAELATAFSFVAKIGNKCVASAGIGGGLESILEMRLTNDFFDAAKYTAANFGSEDILTVISGIRYLRLGRYFPEDKWLSLYATIIEGCMCALELIRGLIISYSLPPLQESDSFDRVLWGNYLKTVLRLAVLSPVAVEHLSEVPKRACAAIAKDIRDRAAHLVNEAWDALAWDATEDDVIRFNLSKFGGYQVEFINDEFGILPDLMMFALQRHQECQTVAVKILWTILVSEYVVNDSLEEVEKECLIGLSDIYEKHSYKPSKEDQTSFIERLKLTVRLDREDVAFGVFYGFIQSLTAFCSTLTYYNSVPFGPEFDEDRMFHQIKLKAQIKAAGKPEMFNSFVCKMYDDHVRKNDFAQAALSLELLASTYKWDHHEIVPASFRPKFPKQTSFERKEILYKMIAANFVKGNTLEKAADAYNELLDAYNEHTYDLKSFAYVHNKLSQLYLDLESSDKLEPSYFRVEAIGTGFPMYMRVISQIYQGLPYEHITSIHERLLKSFPGAIIVSDDGEAQKLKEEAPTGRYLHIKAVEPVWEFSDKLFNTSLGVRQYARNKDLRRFSSLKKIPGATSVFDLWTEQTIYEAWLSFPTMFNRSFIKGSETVRLSPLDNAIRTISRKNDDLVVLESLINAAIKDKADFSHHFNDLSRQLSGTVDSPVNGGVGQYRLFFTDAKFSQTDTDAKKARLLNNAFNELAIILNRCLNLHGKLVVPSMRMAHEALMELFQANFSEEITNLKLAQGDELAPSTRVSVFQERRKDRKQSLSESSINGNSFSGHGWSKSSTNMSVSSGRSDNKLSRGGGGSGTGTSTGDYPSTTPGFTQFSGLASRSLATNDIGAGPTSNRHSGTSKPVKKVQLSTAVNGGW